MLVYFISVMFVVFSLIIGYIGFYSRSMVINHAEKLTESIVKENARVIESSLKQHLDSVKSLVQNLEGLKKAQGQLSRETVDMLLKNMLELNHDLLGVWVCYEENALDGKDELYKNKAGHDKTGRFIPYWSRAGENVNRDVLVDYDDQENGQYYQLPKSTGKSTIIKPYYYEIQGKNIIITSICVPIIEKGNVIGVAGLDISLEDLNGVIAKIKLYENGYGKLLTNTGMMVTHPDSNMFGQNASDLDGEHGTEILEALKSGSHYSTKEYSKYFDEVAFKSFEPVRIGDISTPWSLAVEIPFDEVVAEVGVMLKTLVISGLIGLLIIILLVYTISTKMTDTIKKSIEHLQLIASGDFSRRIPDKFLSLKDEIGDLSRSMDKMQSSIKDLLGEVARAAHELLQSSEGMTTTTENVSADMQHVSASTQEISAGFQEMSASAQEINASSEEMNASFIKLSEEMEGGNSTAVDIEEKAVNLQDKVVTARQNTRNTYTNLEEKLKAEIDKARIVNEISNMAELISEIAEQTNLLALNAAIEAARAGEQGRGFAVVADEVRQLAVESENTVTEIKKMTNQVQGTIKELTKGVSELLSFMDREVMNDYEEFLKTVNQYKDDAALFNTMTKEASLMGKEVLQAVNEVTSSIGEISTTINESAAGIQEIAGSAGNVSGSISEVHDTAGELKDMADKLNTSLKRFKL